MAAMPLIEPIPIAEAEPRRGRGRPPALNPDGSRIHPPRASKPRRASRGRGQASRPSGPRSLQPDIAAFLTMANSIVLMTPLGTKPMQASPMLGDQAVGDPEKLGDELDATEIRLLAGAIDAQCRRSPRFRKYVERVLGAGTGGQLVSILAMILARRASRHGILPPLIDPAIGVLMDTGNIETIRGAMTREPTHNDDTGETPPNMTADDFSNIGTFAEA